MITSSKMTQPRSYAPQSASCCNYGNLVAPKTRFCTPMLTDNEIIAQVLAAFYEEQAEHRQAIGELLLELERHPDHPKRQAQLDQLFREAHSLKGGARAAGQPEVEQVAHLLEDLFSAVRQGRLELTPDTCDPIYAALDVVGVLMSEVAAGQLADLHPHQVLLATLVHIRDT